MADVNVWLLVGTGLFAAVMGSMLGVGGGFIIVPALTLLAHLPMKAAIGSSLIAIVANASFAASRYTRLQFTNIKLGLLMCCTTVPGAIVGGLLAGIFAPVILITLFGLVQSYVAYTMVTRRDISPQANEYLAVENADGTDVITYYDKSEARAVGYRISRIPQGVSGSFLAGVLSSLLGIGGGIVQVPVMNLIMRVPIKAAIGTSTFIMALTTAVGALVYYYHGYIYPFVIAPLLLGVLPGALLGTALTERIGAAKLRRAFGTLLLITAILMFLKAANWI